ncbi:MAG: hypothetical protein JSS75_09640 [Bacteroidetes bacterium]|nr:hypothetical protein [Bacteroidota bacterium]
MQHFHRIWLVGSLVVTLTAGHVRASVLDDSTQVLVDRWVDSVLRASPSALALYRSANSYPRFLELRALSALGITIDTTGFGGGIPVQDIMDTVSAKSVASDAENYQNDPSLVINRRNPAIVAIGANDHRMSSYGMPCYYSVDTGHTWRTTFLPTQFGTQALGDPILAYHIDGTLYYAYMRAEVGLQHDNIMVAISTDGFTWRNGTPVIPVDSLSGYEDKEFICVDRSVYSSHAGRVYVVWTHYDTSGVTGSVKISYSDDTCRTWSLPKTISPDVGHFCEVKTGKYGEVVVGYSVEKDSLTGTHWIAVSKDGCSTFTKRFVSNYTIYPANINGYPALKGERGFRCYPYMSFDVNIFNSQIHLVYGDWFVGGKVAMLYYLTSGNLGANWSFPYAVGYSGKLPSDTTLADRFCPWVSVSQLTGEAYATYYSSEGDTANRRAAAYRVELDHDGSSHARELSVQDFDPLEVKNGPGKQPFIGDYITSDAYEPVYASAWTEGHPDSKIGNIVGFVGVNRTTSAVPATADAPKNDMIRSISPNPVHGNSITVRVSSDHDTPASVELCDELGKRVAVIWEGRLPAQTKASSLMCTLPTVSAGAYIVRVTTDTASDCQWVHIE